MKTKNVLIGSTLLLGTALVLNNKRKKTIPKGVTAVTGFDVNRFLGRWYEIARMDNRFEKNLINTTAFYSQEEDGTIKVINRGYDFMKDKKKKSTGKAQFVGSPNEAKLKVSFFRPFYSGYNVIAIDPEYKYALIAGKSRKYLWLLSREKEMPEEIMLQYLQKAEDLNFDVSRLTWVDHTAIPDIRCAETELIIIGESPV
jgi:apolipoprotein D and lipocalin family protein